MASDQYSEQWYLDKVNANRQPIGGQYYWMFIIKDGTPVVIGARTDENEAWQYAYSKAAGRQVEIRAYDTRDEDEAVRRYKAEILDKTDDLDQATQKIKRKL